METIWKTVEET